MSLPSFCSYSITLLFLFLSHPISSQGTNDLNYPATDSFLPFPGTDSLNYPASDSLLECPAARNFHDPEPNSLIQCLLHHSIPRSLILTAESANFSATLSSSAQNSRILREGRPSKPLLIVTPTLESHAQSTVLCSKARSIQIRTRSGGHDFEGLSYTSSLGTFLLLDLSILRSISFYDDDSTLWVQSGATLGELYHSIASKSPTLAFPAGFCPTVGVGGHISGGGIGTIMREHGIAVDHVIDIRIVDYKGDILERESMDEDMFWALRGGGGPSFGVILAYRLRLVQVPPKVTVFTKSFSLSNGATKALSKWQQEAYRTDNRLYISVIVSVSNSTIQAIFHSLFLGEMAELLLITEQSFPELQVTASDCKEMNWIESAVSFSTFPAPTLYSGPLSVLLDRNLKFPSLSFKVKSDIVTEPITEKSWEKIWKYVLKEDVQLLLLIEPLGGKVAEISETETPFPHRKGSKFVIQHVAVWQEAGERVAKKHIDWLRGFYEFMGPFVSSNPRAVYLNFRDLDLGRNGEDETSYKEALVWGSKYFKSNFERLARAKAKADPENFFRNEQSIPPVI